jgi:hypothetical protein
MFSVRIHACDGTIIVLTCLLALVCRGPSPLFQTHGSTGGYPTPLAPAAAASQQRATGGA